MTLLALSPLVVLVPAGLVALGAAAWAFMRKGSTPEAPIVVDDKPAEKKEHHDKGDDRRERQQV